MSGRNKGGSLRCQLIAYPYVVNSPRCCSRAENRFQARVQAHVHVHVATGNNQVFAAAMTMSRQTLRWDKRSHGRAW